MEAAEPRWHEPPSAARDGRGAGDPLSALAGVLAALADADVAGRYALTDRVLPSGIVLDAGCGEGAGAAILARAGRTVVAVDRAPSPFAPAGVRVSRADLSALDTDDGTYAGIACLDVLDEADAPDRILCELRRTLAPGGVLVVSLREARRAGSAMPFEAIAAAMRGAYAHVHALDATPVVGWRAGTSPQAQAPLPGETSPTSLPPQRRFLIASSAPIEALPGLLLEGPPLDLEALRAEWQDVVELVRGLRLELADARADLERVAAVRARLLEAEQEIGRLPDLRRTLRTLVGERDALRDLLRRALRARPYVQIATVLEALHQAKVRIDDAVREALHALLSEFDRRPDLQAAFSDGGRLRVHELLQWTSQAPADDPAQPMLRQHRPTLTALLRQLPRGRAIVAPVSQA